MATSSVPELSKLRDALDLARREINCQEPDVALQILKAVRSDIEEYANTATWAEHPLLVAQALAAKAAKNDDYPATLFENAIQRTENLPEPDADLQVRAHESFGDFLVRNLGRRSKARRHYESARQIALDNQLWYRTAEIELKIIRIDLEADQDAELENFKTMKRVAGQAHYTPDEQLAVWHQHLGDTTMTLQGMSFARKRGLATEAYFHSLFESVRVA